MDDMGNDELAEYLDALQREERYRVDAVVKESPHEVTQQVSFIGENGAVSGPFIRKLIDRDAGLGSAYERIYAAQQRGSRFVHIPSVLECYARDDVLVVVMEYVHGETLESFEKRVGASEALAANAFPLLCDAVSELHEGFNPPIIHRDLKPSNVILSEAALTIIDFGIAREFKEDAATDTAHLGTRAFAPPEQFGFGQTTVRSDVYALGMLLYYCLTGAIPDPSQRKSWYHDARVSVSMRGVIAKATAFDPLQRYESARALKLAFLRAIGVVPSPTGSTGAASGAASSAAMGAASGTARAKAAPGAASGTARAKVAPGVAYDAAYGAAQVETAPGGVREEAVSAAVHGGVASQLHQEKLPASSAEKAPFETLGKVWNVFITIIVALTCAVSFWDIFHPPESSLGRPLWDNALMYGFAVPLFMLGAWIVVLDKRPLKPYFPWLNRFKLWHYLVAFAALYVIEIVILALVRTVMGS